MTKVFISYSRKDIEFARRLAGSLSEAVLDVWIDVEDIPPGMNWSNAVNEGLKQCEIMLLIVSPTSMASTNVADEWQFYLNNRKPVIPIMIEDADLHYRLHALQHIDFRRQPYGEGLDQLLTALRQLPAAVTPVGKLVDQERPPTEPALLRRRTKLRTMLVGILLLAGVIVLGLLGQWVWSAWQQVPMPTARPVEEATNVTETPVTSVSSLTPPSSRPATTPPPLRPSDITYTGAGVKVAILGTGVDASHPDLRGRIESLQDFTGTGISEESGYGTGVAGIVAGTGKASDGAFTGMAPGASLYMAKVIGESSGGVVDVMKGLDWAGQTAGVDIILLTASDRVGRCDDADLLAQKARELTEQGIVIVAGAGNYGPNPSSIYSPGCAEDVITVGAIDNNESVADYSGRGPTADGRTKPDVVAPGEKLVTTLARESAVGQPIDENYTLFTGTSAASAYVAGVVALMLEVNPELTPRQIKEVLMATATDLGEDQNAQGAGLVNVHAALTAALSP